MNDHMKIKCTHCQRIIDCCENEPLMMAGLVVSLSSPLMPERPCPPSYVCGLCAIELAQWLEPEINQNPDIKAHMARIAEGLDNK